MKQAIVAGAITALAFLVMQLGWYVGGAVGGLLWCISLCGTMLGIGWLLGLALNYKEWF